MLDLHYSILLCPIVNVVNSNLPAFYNPKTNIAMENGPLKYFIYPLKMVISIANC